MENKIKQIYKKSYTQLPNQNKQHKKQNKININYKIKIKYFGISFLWLVF